MVPGSPEEVNACDATALRSILDAHDELPDDNGRTPSDATRVPDLNTGGDGDNAGSSGVTDDMEDVFEAVAELDARDVAERTIARDWTDTSGDVWAFAPTWASADYTGTAVVCGPDAYRDTGKRGGRGGAVVMAAIDLRLISDSGASPGDVTGRDYMRAVDHLRDLGFDIPEYVPDGDSSTLYMDVIGTHAPGDAADPYADPNDCLEACLRAREDGAVPVEADVPALALHPVIDGVLGVSADSHAVDDGTRALARDVVDELTIDTARDRGLIPSAAGNGGEGEWPGGRGSLRGLRLTGRVSSGSRGREMGRGCFETRRFRGLRWRI